VKHLMLRGDVVEAVEAGKFRVIPMETIDQGFELLTGAPTETTNNKIAARLDEFAARAAALMRAETRGTP
jgi:predicted ATP-dependent protease